MSKKMNYFKFFENVAKFMQAYTEKNVEKKLRRVKLRVTSLLEIF
jgi:hypothetical protein